MEILIALIPMVAWGSIGLVSGKIGGDANQQTLGMTIGAFIFSLVVFFIVSPTITPWIFLIGFLSGLAWSVGQNGQFHRLPKTSVFSGITLTPFFTLLANTVDRSTSAPFCWFAFIDWFSINFEYDCGSRFLS